ncbi:MAG: PCRF domain-containing protein, partial [Acidobacteria bacterium]|nr:PCRF domain-containing protein [Acidobacteriota bacterium]
MFEKLEAIEKTYEDLTEQMTDNEIISDQARYTKIAKQHRELEPIVVKFREIKKLDSDIQGNKEILRDVDDAEMRELAEAE